MGRWSEMYLDCEVTKGGARSDKSPGTEAGENLLAPSVTDSDKSIKAKKTLLSPFVTTSAIEIPNENTSKTESHRTSDKSDKSPPNALKNFVELAMHVGIDNGIKFDEVDIISELDNPEDLEGISRPEWIAWATAVGLRLVRERGIVPEGWTKIAHCHFCGPVFSYHDLHMCSCEWCNVREAGKYFPQPNEGVK